MKKKNFAKLFFKSNNL